VTRSLPRRLCQTSRRRRRSWTRFASSQGSDAVYLGSLSRRPDCASARVWLLRRPGYWQQKARRTMAMSAFGPTPSGSLAGSPKLPMRGRTSSDFPSIEERRGQQQCRSVRKVSAACWRGHRFLSNRPLLAKLRRFRSRVGSPARPTITSDTALYRNVNALFCQGVSNIFAAQLGAWAYLSGE
jgi:hypothetical protein